MMHKSSKKENPGIAMRIFRYSNSLNRRGFHFLSKLLYYSNYILFGCVIPPSVSIGEGSIIAHSLGIVIHPSAIIGKNCRIMHNVTLGNSGIVIGDNVFIGTGCVIQGPLTIGDNSRIGANTYVDFDVPDGTTVVGIKGRIL